MLSRCLPISPAIEAYMDSWTRRIADASVAKMCAPQRGAHQHGLRPGMPRWAASADGEALSSSGHFALG